MKIVHLIYSFNTGGSETMLVDIANEQVKQAEVSIVIINKKYNQQLVKMIDNRVKVFFIGRKKSSKNPYPIVKLNLLLLKLGSDVLHCHNHNIVPLLLASLKKKAVLTVHDVGVDTRYFSQFKQLFAISKIVKSDIKERSGIDSNLVYNGIDIMKVNNGKKVEKENKFKIVIVSRLRHLKKGQHLVIEGLHLLNKKNINNIIVDFIGAENIEGESLPYLKSLVENYSLEKNVFFLGHKDRDYVYDNLQDYNLLVQPSLFEGFGLTVAEAMAAKVPVLVSNIDGPIEIIENGRYGYYFESGNAKSLADALEFIIQHYDSEDMKHIIESAYIRVKTCFDIKETAKKYIKEY